MNSDRKWFGSEIIICLLLELIILAAYHKVPDLKFINLDDYDLVAGNSHVQKGLTYENIIWAFAGNYQII